MWKYSTSDELCHYGVRGMRWGVRKAVGSLNEAHSGNSVNKGQHNSSVTKLSGYHGKINKKISSLNAKESKLTVKRDAMVNKANAQRAKGAKHAGTYKTEIGRGMAENAYRKTAKYDKKAYKLDKKISKINKKKLSYDTLAKDIDAELVSKGRDFIYKKN